MTVPPQAPVIHIFGPTLERLGRAGNPEGIGTEPTSGGSRHLRKDLAMRDIQTTVMGNATADPMERKQAEGAPSASVRVAVTGSYFNTATGEFSDRKTEFITVFARRGLARNLLASVRKGQPLVVTGRLSTSEWTGEDDTPRHSLNIQAESIGHDLTYGTAQFTRPLRDRDTPDIDPKTSSILASPNPAEEGEASTDTDADVLDGSYTPAF